jgi:hypothetical protein
MLEPMPERGLAFSDDQLGRWPSFPPGHYRLAGGCVKDALRAPLRNAAELGADLPGQGGHACGVAAGVVAGPLVDRGDP